VLRSWQGHSIPLSFHPTVRPLAVDRLQNPVLLLPLQHALQCPFQAVCPSATDMLLVPLCGLAVWQVGSALLELGVEPKDRVGVFGANCPEWMLAMQVRSPSGPCAVVQLCSESTSFVQNSTGAASSPGNGHPSCSLLIVPGHAACSCWPSESGSHPCCIVVDIVVSRGEELPLYTMLHLCCPSLSL